LSRKKIAIIGGGQVGGILALIAAEKELGDVVIVDIPEVETKIQGKALDIMAARPHDGYDVNLDGTSDYSKIERADVVVVTAGVPRKPGMTREDLLNVNLNIIRQVAKNVKKYAPDSFVIIVSNPLDAIVYSFYQLSGFPRNRVVGMAGALDNGRFRTFIAMETGLSVQDVSCIVMGGHGPTMVPLPRLANVGGVPLTVLLPQEKIDAIVKRVQQAGTEIVKLYANGSAYFSPAAAIVEMVEAYLLDKKRVIPSAARCEGEYGIDGYFIGVPCVIGSGGVEKILEIDLGDEEKQSLANTVEAVKKTVAETGL